MSKTYKIFLLGLTSGADCLLFEKFLEEELSVHDSGKRQQILYSTPSVLLETESQETATSTASYLENIGAKIKIKSFSVADTTFLHKGEAAAPLPKKPRRSLIKKIILGVLLSFILFVGGCILYFFIAIYPKIKVVDNIYDIAEQGRLDEAWDRIAIFVQDKQNKVFGLWALKEIAIKQASEDVTQNRFKEAVSHILAALEYDENDPNLFKNAGFCYYSDKDMVNAEDYLQKALDHGSADARVHQTLALIYYHYLNRIDLALEHCNAALKRQPDNDNIKNLLSKIEKDSGIEEGFTSSDYDWNKFVVKYSGQADPRAADVVMHILEEASSTVDHYLGEHPTEPVIVVLYTNKQFKKTIDAKYWLGDGYFDGRIKVPVKGLPDLDNTDLRGTLHHEYSHVIFRRIVGKGNPVWLNEGLAQYMEEVSGADVTSFGQIDRVKRERTIPFLEELNQSFITLPEKEATKAYATSYLAVKYMLAEYGLSTIATILKELGSGKDFSTAFRDTTGVDFKEFENRFRKSLGA